VSLCVFRAPLQLESLLENGLIKGGDLNNAIVYVDKEISAGTMENLKVAFGKIR
jgi:UDP-3-O-[3-hydroxymyristoyl] N-acetylglucosamine deacetylase/3-hydroxyacyl-[acyl-carrier-protein] dehydratase